MHVTKAVPRWHSKSENKRVWVPELKSSSRSRRRLALSKPYEEWRHKTLAKADGPPERAASMAFSVVSKKSGKTYYLHSRLQKLKGGQEVTLYYAGRIRRGSSRYAAGGI